MKTPLIKCPQRMNAQAYVEMLEANGVHTFLCWCGDNSLFQQDGAPCHTAVLTMRWFRDRGVLVLPNWPANSPDRSPIEQIWALMKRYIVQRFGMRTQLSLAQLEEAIFDAYNHIGWRTWPFVNEHQVPRPGLYRIPGSVCGRPPRRVLPAGSSGARKTNRHSASVGQQL